MRNAKPVTHAALFRYRLPLKRPLVMASGTYTEREGVLLRLRTAGGAEGWGEAAPLPGYSPDTLDEVLKQAAEALPVLRTACAVGPQGAVWSRTEGPPLGPTPSPAWSCAVDQALLSLVAQRGGRTLPAEYARRLVLDDGTPSVPEGAVPINALVPDGAPTGPALQSLAGYAAVKLKVGRSAPEREAARVRAWAEALESGVALRLDANRAWSLQEARAFATALGGVPVEYLEEPCRTDADLVAFLKTAALPVALDESVPFAPRGASEPPFPEGIASRIAAVVAKPTLGRSPATVRRVREAAGRDLPVTVSSAFESGVGLRHLVAFAAALGATPAGLAPYRWLAEDVLERPLSLQGPVVSVADALAPNPVRLEALKRVNV